MIEFQMVSPITKFSNTMMIDITMEQYNSWVGGVLIQDAMPNTTVDEREFIKTGMTPECWDIAFPEQSEV
tara:strand:+ start:85 stop:294 length:210 start_codon:yes stop_codon:yes gene_type:complete